MTFKLQIGLTQSSEQLVGMIQREWPARAKAMARMVAQTAAERTLDTVAAEMPQFASSLKLRKVSGLGAGAYGFVVDVDSPPVALNKLKAETTILHVRINRLLARIPQDVQVLADYSPWTSDTLPFVPSSRIATLVSRKVTQAVVDRVADDRRRDAHLWRVALAREGVRAKYPEGPAHAAPDVAFESLRREFGLGGEPSSPHWRPAVLAFTRGPSLQQLARGRLIKAVMTAPGNSSWKLTPSTPSIGVMGLKRVSAFQKALGIRAKK